jgi:hypothetical protein
VQVHTKRFNAVVELGAQRTRVDDRGIEQDHGRITAAEPGHRIGHRAGETGSHTEREHRAHRRQ